MSGKKFVTIDDETMQEFGIEGLVEIKTEFRRIAQKRAAREMEPLPKEVEGLLAEMSAKRRVRYRNEAILEKLKGLTETVRQYSHPTVNWAREINDNLKDVFKQFDLEPVTATRSTSSVRTLRSISQSEVGTIEPIDAVQCQQLIYSLVADTVKDRWILVLASVTGIGKDAIRDPGLTLHFVDTQRLDEDDRYLQDLELPTVDKVALGADQHEGQLKVERITVDYGLTIELTLTDDHTIDPDNTIVGLDGKGADGLDQLKLSLITT